MQYQGARTRFADEWQRILRKRKVNSKTVLIFALALLARMNEKGQSRKGPAPAELTGETVPGRAAKAKFRPSLRHNNRPP